MGREREIWVVRAGVGGRFAQDFERTGTVAIGWAPIGDATGRSRQELQAAIAAANPETNSLSSASQVYRFVNDIREGDLVITPDGATRELLLGEITGPYRYLHEGIGRAEFLHARQVTWQGRRSRDVLPKRVLYSLGSVLTVFKPQGREHLLALFTGEPMEAAAGDEEDTETSDELVADLEARSAELIDAAVARLDGFETQAVVAGILRAMGFHTVTSAPGSDQGVDIVASRDPLGLEQRVKVQVKARPNSRTGAPELVQLAGNVSSGERGIFVSTGGFTREAEAHPAAHAIARVDGQRLRELLIEYYDRLDSDTRALVPLRRLYFPAD